MSAFHPTETSYPDESPEASLRDFAISLHIASVRTSVCPECDGAGIFIIGYLAPDDLIEQHCIVCDGSGLIDAPQPNE